MHSIVENANKYVPVYRMQDWINIFGIACSNKLQSRGKLTRLKSKMC